MYKAPTVLRKSTCHIASYFWLSLVIKSCERGVYWLWAC